MGDKESEVKDPKNQTSFDYQKSVMHSTFNHSLRSRKHEVINADINDVDSVDDHRSIRDVTESEYL